MKLIYFRSLLVGVMICAAFISNGQIQDSSASTQILPLERLIGDSLSNQDLSVQPMVTESPEQSVDSSKPFKIKWVNNLKDDFAFAQNWDYTLGVAIQIDGKAGCADGGFCPQECYEMMDNNRVIFPDTAERFYQLLDTSHRYYTMSCEA